jgi:sulfur transfer protein SufE
VRFRAPLQHASAAGPNGFTAVLLNHAVGRTGASVIHIRANSFNEMTVARNINVQFANGTFTVKVMELQPSKWLF